ncbi:2-succinyl-5-enolpyruvyl-6-hydroxy-3-cyclohexene-1-carboxylic-acid synthase [Bacillus suaedaesalsae]|uniref:2-succinyl-5-enolpyruvyl-6-hydroxy-3-cyclohexene-1-carboxylate synthase n=1 Tax=Bacillus suaedaesalsae TaxID=2810349 RepID=A0ABS2DHT5_9BACI|nr:2-succinyl-5-enolpyruvyl-6-hydroxy-3-cyclohexene-1-carboxylic-acid synthase [Bacillus suaedaesalsae]MBM6618051.1 2-succinyl-5-enolpyruvyl-6-hydroxy-3-cyclohexene-1-carboxylic-acid synthase [Bacillus suaedaesalsae]
MDGNYALTEYLGAFIDEMVASGVKHAVISPGSRSTPLALLMAEHPTLKTWINIDERSAGFFALGIAKSTQSPVALLCTSGTAAANYFPAIVEATYSRVPLIVLTADRPHELREVGAPQAINQIDMYGSYSKWFVEMAIPENTPALLNYAKTVAARAVATSDSAPAGVVHLNFPLREPLVPNFNHVTWSKGDSVKKVITNKEEKISASVIELLQEVNQYEKGIIVCGPQDQEGFPKAVTELAEVLGYPILADPLSQLRSGKHAKENVVECYDAILKCSAAFEALKPDVVIRLGAMPVSKVLTQLISASEARYHLVVDENLGFRDPTLKATHFLHYDEVVFCKEAATHVIAKRKAKQYLQQWIKANEIARPILQSHVSDFHFEGDVVRRLTSTMKPHMCLFIGNSMPIRDVDSFYFLDEKNIRILANRGANGIDGIISTALGASIEGKRLVLLVGDITFYHDLNGLLASKLHNLPITIVVVNNNGGGIFSFLPQAKEEKHFELLFGTPMDLDFEKVVNMYGGRFKRVQSWSEYEDQLLESYEANQLTVIEVPTASRDENVKLHRNLWNEVTKELQNLF